MTFVTMTMSKGGMGKMFEAGGQSGAQGTGTVSARGIENQPPG